MARSKKVTQPRIRNRIDTVLALKASGLTQRQIAVQLGVSRATVVKDLAQVKPALVTVNQLKDRANRYIEDVMPIEERIDVYVEQAKNKRMPQYRQAAAMRLDTMQGFPSKDTEETGEHQPLIVIKGVSVSFGPTLQVSSTTPESKQETPAPLERPPST